MEQKTMRRSRPQYCEYEGGDCLLIACRTVNRRRLCYTHAKEVRNIQRELDEITEKDGQP